MLRNLKFKPYIQYGNFIVVKQVPWAKEATEQIARSDMKTFIPKKYWSLVRFIHRDGWFDENGNWDQEKFMTVAWKYIPHEMQCEKA